jgi:hypothetical protein
MRPIYYALAALVLILVNGLVHGFLTQRWSVLTEGRVDAAADRISGIPLQLPSWKGQEVETDAAKMPEEVVGRNVSVSYEHRITHKKVLVYLACGRTAALELHTPLECYPANGYTKVGQETRVSVPHQSASPHPEFWTATFSIMEGPLPVNLRVFWAWQGATGGWQVPDNRFRTFRASPFLYKCYTVRQLTTAGDPLEGEPCLDLLAELIPSLEGVLVHDR